MTVNELIDVLSGFDGRTEVYFSQEDHDYWHTVSAYPVTPANVDYGVVCDGEMLDQYDYDSAAYPNAKEVVVIG